MISSKDPDEYPTLYHYRNAASHRSTMKRSLRSLYKKLLVLSKGKEKEEEPVELANCYPSPAEPEARPPARSTLNQQETPLIRMPCVTGVSGYTPGRGFSIAKPHPQFVDRCMKCNGSYAAKRVIKNGAQGDPKKAGRRVNVKKGKTKPKKPEQRRRCHLCGSKTNFFCFGCHRYLCNMPPKNGEDRDSNKHQSQFQVNLPRLAPDGRIMQKNGEIVFEKQFGVLTCYHIAHKDRW